MINSDNLSNLKGNSEFRDNLFSFLDQFKRTIVSVEEFDRRTAEQIYDAMRAVSELAELYNLIAQQLVNEDAQSLQIQSLGKFLNSFEVKARSIASIVRGTRLEWEKAEKYLTKGKFIGIDLDKDKDPDMRVHSPNSTEKAKVIEFKSTSGTEETIKNNIKNQLTSAIFQLCKRSVDYEEMQFSHRKLNAVVEINYNQDLLQNKINEFGAFDQSYLFEYFSEIIKSSWSRGKIGKSQIFSMVEINKLGWNRENLPEIAQLEAHPSQFFDKKWASMFQINFILKPFLKVKVKYIKNGDVVIDNSFGKEVKFLVYFIENKGVKTVSLHRVMMMKSIFELNGSPVYNLYNSGHEMPLRIFR